MILHFMRHGQAENYDRRIHASDSARLLTPEGCEIIRQGALGFKHMGMQFEAVVSSPYPRAVETAKIVADVFRFQKPIEVFESLIPESNFKKFRAEYMQRKFSEKSILFVTHQPFVSECLSRLVGDPDEPISFNMGTGTVCTIDSDPGLGGYGILMGMISAEQAAMIGGKR